MAPFRYDPYDSSRWTGSIADMIRLQGRIPAEAALRIGQVQADSARAIGAMNADAQARNGQIWGGAVASIGNNIAGAITQANDPRRKLEEQQTQEGALRLKELQAHDADRGAMDAAFAPMVGPREDNLPPGQPKSRDEIISALPGHLQGVALKQFSDADENRAKVQKTHNEYLASMTDHLAGLRYNIEYWKGDPTVAKMAIDDAKQTYQGDQEMLQHIARTEQLIAQNPTPENILKIAAALPTTEKYAALEKKSPGFSLNPNESRYEDGKLVVTAPPAPVQPKERVPPALGSFEDYIGRKYGQSPTPDQIEAGRKAYGQADDRVRPPDATAGSLDPDGLELAATTYRLTKALPARNAAQNGAIISAAAKQAKALGNSPVATIQKQAAYQADASALKKMQGMASAAEAFESKAIAQAGLVSDLSTKVSRTDFPLINGLLLAGKEAAGDTNTQLFSNALISFTNEYGKIMEGATGSAAGSSDSARRDAAQLISKSLKDGTVQKTLQQMQWEMRQTLNGYDATIAHITSRMGDGAMSAPSVVAPAAAPGGRQRVVGPNGESGTVPVGTALPPGWKVR